MIILMNCMLPYCLTRPLTVPLSSLIAPCPYVIDVVYSIKFKGTKQHEFAKVCYDNHINQKFTKVATPRTNGKAERVIRTMK